MQFVKGKVNFGNTLVGILIASFNIAKSGHKEHKEPRRAQRRFYSWGTAA
jgi:hypothetical protein